MQDGRQNLMVGLFVLVGLSAVGTLIVLFGSGMTDLLGGPGFPLHINFGSASGIRAGNPVTLGGIRIGRVASVDFVSTDAFEAGVRVTAQVDQEYERKIPADSRAFATEPGLGLGRPPVDIVPGSDRVNRLSAGSEISGTMRGAVESIVPETIRFTFEKTAVQLGEAASALTPVLKDLHEILMQRSPADVDRPGGPQGNLSAAMARLDKSLSHFNDVLGDPAVKSQLKEAIANFHAASEDGRKLTANLRASSEEAHEVVQQAKTFVAQAQATVENLDQEITSVCRDARGMLQQGDQLLGELHGMAAAVQRGEGTLGRLVNDAKLYEALVFTTERIGQALEEFRLLVKEWQKGKVRVAF